MGDISGIFVADQAEALRAAGFDVRVVHAYVSADRSGPATSAVGGSARVHRVIARGRREAFDQPRLVIGVCRAALELRRQGFRPDVVHAHTDKAAAAAWAVSRLLRVPFGVTEHSSEWVDAEGVPPARRRVMLARRSFRAAAFVIAVSTRLASGLRSTLGVQSIDVVPNAVDPAFFGRHVGGNEVAHVVTTGSLVREKDFALLLRSFAIARRRIDCRLTIIGEGALEAELIRIARELGIEDFVTFTGQRPRSEVVATLATADVYVCSSSIETFGVAVCEALAVGVPVVATRCGGPEDFVTEAVGVLVDDRNPASLADAVVRVLASPVNSHDTIAEYAWRTFSPPAVAAHLAVIYDRAGAISARGNSAARRETREAEADPR
ncbi:MAG: glycosyltransferase [Mycobacteriales bacterium]